MLTELYPQEVMLLNINTGCAMGPYFKTGDKVTLSRGDVKVETLRELGFKVIILKDDEITKQKIREFKMGCLWVPHV